MKDDTSNFSSKNRRKYIETSSNNKYDNMSGIDVQDSDDESLSISLPSNNEDTRNHLTDKEFNDKHENMDEQNLARSTLKKQILRILSTDDEEEIEPIRNNPEENGNEG